MEKKLVRNVGYLVSLCLFAVAMLVLHHELKNYHSRDIVAELGLVRTPFLALAVLLTILDYLVLTTYDALALRYIKHRLEYTKIALASFIGHVFSHNMTIVGGSTARYRIYSALGVSASQVARLVLFCTMTFWLGFFALVGIVFVFQQQQVPEALHLPISSVLPIGIVFLMIVVGYFAAIVIRRKPLNLAGWEFEIPPLRISIGQIIIASLDWVLACGVLYALLPASLNLTYTEFLGMFLLAQAAGLLSYVPGGLGVFETVILLLLSDKLEKSTTISCLVLYRLIYYLLPFIAATVLLAFHELAPKRNLWKRLGDAFGKWSFAVTPHALAVAGFIAGAVLLFSGAMPAAKSRMTWLQDMLPLATIELSHFLGSLVGAALLILARGLQRRVDVAYHLTVVSLILGIAFSLLKGLDYEEAVILAAVLMILLPCRREFYRKASLIDDRFTPAWIILTATVLITSVWLGFFSYKHIEYSNQLWWRFAVHSDAPRFLRATTGAAILTLLYALARLLLPAPAKQDQADAQMIEHVETIVAGCKRTYANLALLGDKTFLFSEQGNAFIMYGVEGRSWIAMGDPVGPRQEWQPLLWKFRELADGNGGWPVFYQVNNENLDMYVDHGMTFFKLGEEGRVSLQDFTLEGPSRKPLRYPHNKIQKQGYSFEVIAKEDVPQILGRLKEISDAWLAEKNTREKGFSIGFFDPDYIAGFPMAVVRSEDQIVAFANIWPGSENEELSIDLMRHSASAPNGIMDYLFVELMLWGRRQGYHWFSLGMAPMSGLEDRALAPVWHKLGTFVFRHGEHFYNFQGLRQYKEKFEPEWQPRYLACPKGLMLPRVLANVATLISGGLKGIVSR